MIDIKEHISINELEAKSYKIPLYEKLDKAILTHYLHNLKNNNSSHYKRNAVNVLENFIKYKNEENDYSIAKEEALQYLLLELENVPFPSPMQPKFEFIDLFAGVGGFRLAMQNNGGKCVFSSEIDEAAQKTYFTNYGETPFGDITKDGVKKYIPQNFDILCAGFPCQPFSIAGNRKGYSDTRGTLFFDVEQIIEKHRPKVVFLENVKNFVSHDKGNTFRILKEILEDKLKYKVFYKVLNSMTYANIPQNRERIFIVAFDPKQVENFNNFKFPNEIKLTNTIHSVLEKGKLDDYYYYNNHQYFPILDKEMKSKDTIYQWRRVYVRENKSNVCPTLTANMGTGGHNVPLIRDEYGIRKLTPRECFSFQGYPDNFELPQLAKSKLYKQAGNSITVPLIDKITQEIVKVM